MAQQRFVAYCRSSTPEQVIGLEVQRQRINAYVDRVHGDVIAWYQEMRPASPTAAKVQLRQPELCRALEHCRRAQAILIVSRLDRLTRSAALLTSLLENGCRLLVADIPFASTFVLQIYAAVAEEYRQRTSRRLKAVKARAKAEGRKLSPHARILGRRQHREALERTRPLCALIEKLRTSRRLSAGDVARELNARGVKTPAGREWSLAYVTQFWRRYHRHWDLARFPGRPSAWSSVERIRACNWAESLRLSVERYRQEGAKSAPEIGERLNADGIATATGLQWSIETVHRLLRRLRQVGERHA